MREQERKDLLDPATSALDKAQILYNDRNDSEIKTFISEKKINVFDIAKQCGKDAFINFLPSFKQYLPMHEFLFLVQKYTENETIIEPEIKKIDLQTLLNSQVSALDKAQILYNYKNEKELEKLLSDNAINLYEIAKEGGHEAVLKLFSSTTFIKVIENTNPEGFKVLLSNYIKKEQDNFEKYCNQISGPTYFNKTPERESFKVLKTKILQHAETRSTDKAYMLAKFRSEDELLVLLNNGAIKLFEIAKEGGSKAFLNLISLERYMAKEDFEFLVQFYINEPGFFIEFSKRFEISHNQLISKEALQFFNLKINLFKNTNTDLLAKANILHSLSLSHSYQDIQTKAPFNLFEIANHNSQAFLVILDSVYLMHHLQKNEVKMLVDKYRKEEGFIEKFKKCSHNLPSGDLENWLKISRFLANYDPYKELNLKQQQVASLKPDDLSSLINKNLKDISNKGTKLTHIHGNAKSFLTNSKQKMLLDEHYDFLNELIYNTNEQKKVPYGSFYKDAPRPSFSSAVEENSFKKETINASKN